MIIVGMDIAGVAFWNMMDENVTVTAEGYKNFLDEYVSDWCYQRGVEDPILLHDNARPHKSRIVGEFLEEKNSTLLPHPSYSPDMRPCDFNCFVHLKERLRGHRYQDFDQFNIAIKKFGA